MPSTDVPEEQDLPVHNRPNTTPMPAFLAGGGGGAPRFAGAAPMGGVGPFGVVSPPLQIGIPPHRQALPPNLPILGGPSPVLGGPPSGPPSVSTPPELTPFPTPALGPSHTPAIPPGAAIPSSPSAAPPPDIDPALFSALVAAGFFRGPQGGPGADVPPWIRERGASGPV